MPIYTSTYQSYSIDQINYYFVPSASHVSFHTSYGDDLSAYAELTCTCYDCNRYRREYERRLAEQAMIDHFTLAYIPFHPTDDYVNVTPEKDNPVINPLPEPELINITARSNPNRVLAVVVAGQPIDLSYQQLEGANFSGMDLRNANFRGANLRNTMWRNANAEGANFDRVSLGDAYMAQADFTNATFEYANLDYADVTQSNFTGARFDRASLFSVFNTSSANFEDASFLQTGGIQQCEGCDYIEFRHSGTVHYLVDLDERRCEGCGGEQCEHCSEWFDDLYYHQDHCSERRHHALHEYDYSPYRFRPKGNYPAEALMGVELEVGGDEYNLTNLVNQIDPAENHLYCKHDGSVDGIEIVTHPMTLNWAKQNFDFKKLLDGLSTIGHSSDGYGIHVHVSRNAFRGVNPDGTTTKAAQPKHQMAWLMFMYRNAANIASIARRDSDNWASWRKPGKGELKRKAQRPDHSTGRYVAINCENDRTYEVRVFRSTLNFTEFMAAIELVDASVNYTRDITVQQVLHNQAMSWSEFHKWCVSQGARYSNLLNQMIVQGTLD